MELNQTTHYSSFDLRLDFIKMSSKLKIVFEQSWNTPLIAAGSKPNSSKKLSDLQFWCQKYRAWKVFPCRANWTKKVLWIEVQHPLTKAWLNWGEVGSETKVFGKHCNSFAKTAIKGSKLKWALRKFVSTCFLKKKFWQDLYKERESHNIGFVEHIRY